MQKHVWILIVISGVFLAVSETKAQYIEYTYDAAGNRTRRQYIPPPPIIVQVPEVKAAQLALDQINPSNAAIVTISGNFSVNLKEPLINASVNVIDVSGRTILHNIANGNRLEYNLYNYPAGIYLLQIFQKGKPVVGIKLIKQ